MSEPSQYESAPNTATLIKRYRNAIAILEDRIERLTPEALRAVQR